MDDIVKIATADYSDKGASSLPDVPEMSAASLKRKFDEISIDVLIPKLNETIDRCNDLKTIAEQSGQVTQSQIESWTAAAILAATALQPSDITTLTSLTNILTYNNAAAHNALYRGKSLGNAVTEAQYTAIGAGTFADLYIGDYWTINEIVWRIAAFDYFLNYGEVACTDHHVVIVPDANLVAGTGTSKNMHYTDSTAGAYVGTDFYKGTHSNTAKATCISAIESAFGSGHILSHSERFSNAVSSGCESGSAWYTSTVELLTEYMVFGGRMLSNLACGTNLPSYYTVGNAQLPLFALDHSRICNRSFWVLRDVTSSSTYAMVHETGTNAVAKADNTSIGIRPYFALYAGEDAS